MGVQGILGDFKDVWVPQGILKYFNKFWWIWRDFVLFLGILMDIKELFKGV